MSWTEPIILGPIFGRDAGGVRTATRVFRVSGYSRSQILDDPTAIVNDNGEPMPGYNSEFEGMRLDHYQVSALGTRFDARAMYSNDGRYRQAPQRPIGDGATSWSGHTREEVDELMYFTRTESEYATGAGETALRFGWAKQPWRVPVKRGQNQLRVEVAASLVPIAIQANRRQAGSLHQIYGDWHRYEGATYRQIDAERWEFNYTWFTDGGIPAGGLDVGDVNFAYVRIPNREFEWEGETFIRRPYHQLMGRVFLDSSSGPPFPNVEWFDIRHGRKDADGFRELPGVNL